MQRLFGSDVLTPEIEEGIKIAQKEIPNLAPVKPYGFFSRLAQPKAMGYVSPSNTIYLNPRTMQGQSPQDVADTLLHEQTHVEQTKRPEYSLPMEFIRGLIGKTEPYHRRPSELEAFQAEKLRRSRMGRMQTAIPEFTTGKFYVPRDVHLPKENGIKTGPTSSTLKKFVGK